MYQFFVLGVDVRCPYRESGWKQTEIMLHCVISLWFTWLCLISSVIKRKLAVLCATARGWKIWRRRLKSLMKIGSDDCLSLKFPISSPLGMRLGAFSKKVSAEMSKNYRYDRCAKNVFENQIGGKWLTHLFNRQMCHNQWRFKTQPVKKFTGLLLNVHHLFINDF